MWTNPFKEAQKARTKLREVCIDCSQLIRQDEDSPSKSWSFAWNSCNCKESISTPASAGLPAPEALGPKPAEDDRRSEEGDVNIGSQYHVIETIGRGGMGTVYRAKDKSLGKEFAIKVLHDDLAADDSAIKRFEQEAKAASELTHANLLSVYSNGRTKSGAPYIVMDLLEGESLAQVLLREYRIEPERLVDISIQICEALAHAHMKGLIHRDLKPSNIMLIDNIQVIDMVKVLDFGIAKAMPTANRETQNLTQTGELFGSPSYMSPEQCLGCNLDARSDVYSLGCLMYEMLTGKLPFAGKNPIQTVVKHLNDEPLPITRIASRLKVPRGLEAVIMRCLEKDPALRYQSMDHLRADLQLIASGQIPKQIKKQQAKPVSFVSQLIITVVLVGIVLVSTFLSNECLLHDPAHGLLVFSNYLLALVIAIFWTTVLGKFCWKQIKIRNNQTIAPKEWWSVATLGFLFGGCLSTIGILLSFPPSPNPLVPLCDVSSMLAAFFFLLAFAASIGWVLHRAVTALNFAPQSAKRLNLLWIAALAVAPLFAHSLLARIPFSIGQNHQYCWNGKTNQVTYQPNLANETAILIDPGFAEAYYARALRKLDAGRSDAMEDFNRALGSHPEKSWEAKILRARAKIFYNSGDYQSAIRDISRVMELEPDKGPIDEHYVLNGVDYFSRARCYQKTKQYQDALADYTKISALYPSRYHAHEGRGEVYEQLGNNQQALADYSNEIEWNPDNLSCYVHRASLYKKLGQLDKAIQDYKTLLKRFSGWLHFNGSCSSSNYRCVASAEEELGMHKEAQNDLAKALESEKHRPSLAHRIDGWHLEDFYYFND